MARLRINYSLSYDWLLRGRPEGDWQEMLRRGLAYQDAARAQWEPYESQIFTAFESFGLRFWDAWPAYPVEIPEGVNEFKDPLTFRITEDWEHVREVLVHELCHLHEDHPANRDRYEKALAHVREIFAGEDEGVQYHLITCTLQRAVLMRAFPDSWRGMLAGVAEHPVLRRTWELIEQRESEIDWIDPLGNVTTFRR